jgi:hypothetical protein
MSLGDMELSRGFVPPWAWGVARDVVAPWAIDQALNWLGNWLTEQTKINQEIICNLESSETFIPIIPDPRAVTNTHGSYLFFFWKLAGASGDEEKRYHSSSQLADPIDEILYPADPKTVWETYFAGISIIKGNQYGAIWTKDKSRRYPLYQGFFNDISSGRTALRQIAALSKI